MGARRRPRPVAERLPPTDAARVASERAARSRDETDVERLDRNLIELLQEVRVVQTGVQVLFAFLLTVPFSARFDEITDFQRGAYFAALVGSAAASVLLIAPTAVHRILFRLGQKEYMVEVSNRLALGGLLRTAVSMVAVCCSSPTSCSARRPAIAIARRDRGRVRRRLGGVPAAPAPRRRRRSRRRGGGAEPPWRVRPSCAARCCAASSRPPARRSTRARPRSRSSTRAPATSCSRRSPAAAARSSSARSFRADEGIAGHVVQTGAPLIVDDLAREPRFAHDIAVETGYQPEALAARADHGRRHRRRRAVGARRRRAAAGGAEAVLEALARTPPSRSRSATRSATAAAPPWTRRAAPPAGRRPAIGARARFVPWTRWPRSRSRPRACARSATVGRLAAEQAARQLGTRAANLTRDDERAQEALARRQVETAEQIVAALGTMKGAAMKLGQVMSFLDVGLVPPEYREQFQAKLAELRDAAPKVSFKDMKKVIEQEYGEKIEDVFETFDPVPIAAASIGQVYRARLDDGRDVAVKVQYPGVGAGGPGRHAEPRDDPAADEVDRARASTRSRWPRRSARASTRSSTTSSRPRTSARSRASTAATRSS